MGTEQIEHKTIGSDPEEKEVCPHKRELVGPVFRWLRCLQYSLNCYRRTRRQIRLFPKGTRVVQVNKEWLGTVTAWKDVDTFWVKWDEYPYTEENQFLYVRCLELGEPTSVEYFKRVL